MAQYNDNTKSFHTNKVLHETCLPVNTLGEPVHKIPTAFHAFNNFADGVFAANATKKVVFAIRVKSGSDIEFWVDDYVISNTSNNECAYEWYMSPTYSSTPTWSELDSSGIEYFKGDGTMTVSGGILAHSGIVTAKDTSTLTAHMNNAKFTDGGMEIVLVASSLSSNSSLWYSCTLIK